MKRKSKIIPKKFLDIFISELPELHNSKIELRIDEQNSEKILSFLKRKDKNGNLKNKKKFTRILYTALQGKYNRDIYSKEEVSNKAKNVTAMKFKGKENIRIGCKEIFCDGKKIIMVTEFYKKTQKNSKREIAIYETIGGYEYEC